MWIDKCSKKKKNKNGKFVSKHTQNICFMILTIIYVYIKRQRYLRLKRNRNKHKRIQKMWKIVIIIIWKKIPNAKPSKPKYSSSSSIVENKGKKSWWGCFQIITNVLNISWREDSANTPGTTTATTAVLFSNFLFLFASKRKWSAFAGSWKKVG